MCLAKHHPAPLSAARDDYSFPARSIFTFLALVLALFAALGSGPAFAEGPRSIGEILGATPATDKSTEILRGAIGDFFVSPMSTVGGSTTLLGGMFLIFNGGIFLVSVLWGSYNVGRGIVGTAQEGAVLGNKMSTVWLPIRMVTGIAGVVPVFAGFNLAQVVHVLTTGIGIGLANMMFLGAINLAGSQFQSMFHPETARPTTGVSYRDAATALFEMHVCRLAKQAEERAGGGVAPDDVVSFSSVSGTLASSRWGTRNNPDLCGSVALFANDAAVRHETRFAFRNAAVNYTAIATNVQNGYASAYASFDSSVSSLATTWWTARARTLATGGATVPLPVEQLDAAATAYSVAAQNRAASAARSGGEVTAIAAPVMETMKSDGWAGLGAWYSTFAEVSTAISDAVRSIDVRLAAPNASKMSTTVADAMNAVNKAAATHGATAAAPGSSDNAFTQVKAAVGRDTGFANVTGEWSFGQVMIEKAIGFAETGGTGEVSLINPIIAFKNMGDYLLIVGEGMWVGAKALEFAADRAKDAADTAGSLPGPLGTPGKAVSKLADVAAKGMELIKMIAGVMIVAGAFMAVYIPMIPFLAWMGALVQYAVVFIEGLVAMPLAALSHMEAEGDGLGSRTERGYIFLLNMLARPACMVFGFFLASTLMVLLGTFQMKLFMGAVANAQGNSVTGLITIVGMLLIFLVLNWTLIQGLFNMVFLLPDQVIGMVGNSSTSDLGRDVEGKVHNLFVGIQRQAGANVGAMGRVLGARQGPNGSAAAGATGARSGGSGGAVGPGAVGGGKPSAT